MGLIPILALCATLNGGLDRSQCTFVDDLSFAYTNVTACEIRALSIARSKSIQFGALLQLYNQYGYTDTKLSYSFWCIEEDDVYEFYMSIGGVTGMERIPRGI